MSPSTSSRTRARATTTSSSSLFPLQQTAPPDAPHCVSSTNFPFSRAAGSGEASLFLHNLSGKLYFLGQNRDKLSSDEEEEDHNENPLLSTSSK